MDRIIIGPYVDLSLFGFRRIGHPQSVQERLQTVIDVPSFTEQLSRRLLSKECDVEFASQMVFLCDKGGEEYVVGSLKDRDLSRWSDFTKVVRYVKGACIAKASATEDGGPSLLCVCLRH